MYILSDFSYTYIPPEEWSKIPPLLAAKIRARETKVGKDNKDKKLTNMYSKAKKYANFQTEEKNQFLVPALVGGVGLAGLGILALLSKKGKSISTVSLVKDGTLVHVKGKSKTYPSSTIKEVTRRRVKPDSSFTDVNVKRKGNIVTTKADKRQKARPVNELGFSSNLLLVNFNSTTSSESKSSTKFIIKGKKRVEHGGLTYSISKPSSSQRKNKKYQVTVERSDGKKKTVAFGQKGYQDFTEHKDPDRRRRYQARASAIKKKDGSLAKDDPFSPNYYSTKYTW